MSLIRRIWRAITRPTGFVGRDLEGNSFYERAGANSSGRTRRIVKYRRAEDQWMYIGGQRRLPIQWTSWLSHTRANPPTLQELQLDLLRQQRVQQNVAMIQAADDAERREQQMLLQAGPTITEAASQPQAERQDPSPSPAQSQSVNLAAVEHPPASSKKAPSKPLPQTGPDEYKPESWSPRVAVQRGG
ncbi:hypothetical protein V5O48_006617 [Marasmius crinis-equi]|uniref:NADH dehydrogenase [ubiquinone] 1 alpha subcomplex subunit n=1 Tax=Marasmius crinis-equi TaxID=585013 RepID=A0ABR3FJ34_9AGAR